MVTLTRARILKHFKVAAEKIALGKVNFSNGILNQPDFSVIAVCHCGQETYPLATGLNAAVLVTLPERQLVCLRIPKMQVWLERYLFKRKVIFSTSMKCLRIRAQVVPVVLYTVVLYTHSSHPENRNQDRSQCKPLRRRNSDLLTDSAAYICLYPPPKKNLTFSRYMFAGGGGGLVGDCIEIAAESVNRSLFRQRKGLHWLLSWFLFSVHTETSARRSLLRQFRQCESFSPYFASTGISRSLLCHFRQREDFFAAISQCTAPIGYNFVVFLSVFAQISLRNLQTIQFLLKRGRSYHSTLLSFFCCTSLFPSS